MLLPLKEDGLLESYTIKTNFDKDAGKFDVAFSWKDADPNGKAWKTVFSITGEEVEI